jgi:hypothetical protein
MVQKNPRPVGAGRGGKDRISLAMQDAWALGYQAASAWSTGVTMAAMT